MTPPRTFGARPDLLWKVLWFSLAFIAAGIFMNVKIDIMLLNGMGRLLGLTGVRIVGFIGIGVGVIGAIFAGVRLATHRPALLVDDHGMTLDAPTAPLGRVAWSQVQAIGTLDLMERRFLVVVPHELERRIAMLPPVKRHLVMLNQRTLGTSFAVPEPLLGVRLEEVIAEITRRAPHLAL
jgi:hypothetical protein